MLVALAAGLADCEPTAKKKPAPSHAPASDTARPDPAAPPDTAADGTANAPSGPPTAGAETNDVPNGPTAASADAARTVSADAVLAEVRRLGGKGTLVNVWASWCGPCKHELPMIVRLAADVAPRGLHVLLVSLDEPGDHDKADAFLQERSIKLPSYFAERPLGRFKQGMNPRWPGMVPASFLFDASGTLRYFWGGEAFEEELTPVISALIAGKPIQGEAAAEVAPEGDVHR